MNPVEYTGREKRITFQLYNYWFGLADGCGIPPLKALTPDDIIDYKNNMVLIDLRDPDEEPTLQVIGQLLNDDLDQDLELKSISEIPRRTLLSRITDHYMEVLANKSPISFDAEFKNKNREKILYRGILLPFSDDGENINFILGAIRWISEEEMIAAKNSAAPQDDQEETEDAAALQKSLKNCRNLVKGQNPADARSRKALYEALGAILDFHNLCLSNPNSYGEILETEGLKTQKRAPFTPTLKLCFGKDYDKTRLTEYAAALSFALKNDQNGMSLPDFLDQYPGGIKGCVQAEREGHNIADDPDAKTKDQDFQKSIENMATIAQFDVDEASEGEDELCLLLARRKGTSVEVIKILKEDEKLMGPILKSVTNDP